MSRIRNYYFEVKNIDQIIFIVEILAYLNALSCHSKDCISDPLHFSVDRGLARQDNHYKLKTLETRI